MHKHLMVATLVTSAILLSTNLSFAEKDAQQMPPMECPNGAIEMKQGFNGAPPKFNKRGSHKGPSKADMEAKRAEIEQRLNLTEEQKEHIREQKMRDHEKMKPVFEEMKAKKHAIRMVDFDTTLNQEQKEAKKKELKSDIINLKTIADTYREENLKNFESILTDKQQKEFSKIREEQKQEMEKRREHFKERRPDFTPPVQPKPQPVKK